MKQLKKTPNSKVVILLDEIDQLLDWDKQHTSEEVPEAFFRACRTVSQEGEAQFVFSGERMISSRVWGLCWCTNANALSRSNKFFCGLKHETVPNMNGFFVDGVCNWIAGV